MSQRHIMLDNDLKRVSSITPLEGLPSFYDRMRQSVTWCTGAAVEPIEVTHRWCLSAVPAEGPRFLADAAPFILRPVQVQLLTEQEFLDRTGQRTGASPAMPFAEQFAREFSQRLAADPAPCYSPLTGLPPDRVKPVAGVPTAAGNQPQYLLGNIPT